MSREITDTGTQDNPLPEGRRTFCVAHAKRIDKNGNAIYVWTLSYEGGDGVQILLPSMMGDLLRVLGATEVSKDKFDWETQMMEGKYFDATVSRSADKKGVIRQNMTEFAPSSKKDDDIPF